MNNAPLRSLEEALGNADIHPDMEGLTAEETDALASSIKALKRHQEESLERAIEEALSHIPGVLRRSVRKKLFS